MKKVSFYIMLVVSLLAVIFATATVWQLVPIVIYLFLAYLNIWKKSKNNHGILALAIIMIIMNIYQFSLVDIFMWTLIAFSHKEVV